MKRITIIAPGSRGDVQPYIALGVGLRQAGFQVHLVTHENYESLVSAYDLEFWPIVGDVSSIVQSEAMRERVEGGNFLRLMSQMAKESQRGAIAIAAGGLEASRGADLLLAGMGGIFTGLALAEKLDLPLMQAYLVPFTPSSTFPSVLTPNLPAWGNGAIKRLSHHLTRQLIWQGFRSADRLARQKTLGLPPAPFTGPYNSPQTRGLPILYGISPAVISPPPDWGPEVHLTGYWFLDSAEDWTPPIALTDFLSNGPAPVYIGFGSMSNRDPEKTARIVLQALDMSGQRAVLLSGWGGLASTVLPDTILMIDSIPHSWLFPHMAAIFHHGGAGTTAAALRSGVPSGVIPFFGDQPFWGQRVAELGAGPRPIPRRQLDAGRLAAAIWQSTSDPDMQRRAAELGRVIQAEDGVARAVEWIQSVV